VVVKEDRVDAEVDGSEKDGGEVAGDVFGDLLKCG